MKNTIRKKIFCIVLAISLAAGLGSGSVQAKKKTDCKSLCSAALKATGGSKHLKYSSVSAIDFGALSAGNRNKVKKMQYVCDAKEVYSICIMEASGKKDAKKLLRVLQSYKKSNCKSDYLSDYSAAEQKVFQNAVCGKKGKYVWYIAMSPGKTTNIKGQKAIQRTL
jgi:hypothetical protein